MYGTVVGDDPPAPAPVDPPRSHVPMEGLYSLYIRDHGLSVPTPPEEPPVVPKSKTARLTQGTLTDILCPAAKRK